MHDYSTVDGFMDVNDCVVEMIQRVANEPSVGLFYVQQHTQNAVPNLIRTKNRVVEKSNEVALHTADLEDSINVVRSMKDLGVPIADQMTKDIQKSLIMLSSMKLQKRPFSNRLTSEGEGSSSWRSMRMARSGSLGGSMFGSSSLSSQVKKTGNWDHEYEPSTSEPSQMTESKRSSKLSTMLNSAKQKASVLRWLQRDASAPYSLDGRFPGSIGPTPLHIDIQADDPPLSRQISQSEVVEHHEPAITSDPSVESCIHDPSEIMESYEKFKSDREAKLEEWLKETDNDRRQIHTNENTANAD